MQENHNIFAKLNPDEYREVLGNVKHCILATDLALFFPNKARLTNILKEEAFSWELPDHRYPYEYYISLVLEFNTYYLKKMILEKFSIEI